jgi:hypothetical protein
MALSSGLKVLQRGVDRGGFFPGQSPASSAIRYHPEDLQKALDSTVAILEHAEGIVESGVWFRADLNSHFLAPADLYPAIGTRN